MINVQLSPGDPLFWLHHGWIDSLWWRWQVQDLATRIKDMTGPNMPSPLNFTGFGGGPGGPGGASGLPAGCFGSPVPTTGPDGNPTVTPPFGGGGAFPPPAFKENKAITSYFGDGGGNVTTMNHTLWSGGILPNATIADVMDLRGTFACSDYV